MKHLPIVSLGILACLRVTLTVAGGLTPQDTQSQPVVFDIHSQPLGAALDEFGRQAHMRVVLYTALSDGFTAPQLTGEYTSTVALGRLLAATGLRFEYLDEHTVAVLPQKPVVSKSSDANTAGSDTLGLRVAQSETPSATADEGKPTGTDKENQNGLEEVVVTAERREEGIDKVPVSVTALSQQFMDDFHIVNMVDIAAVVPGISLAPRLPSNQDGGDIAIRGIYSNGNAPTTQIYIDETPITIRQLPNANSSSPLPYVFDLDRVEVLRGPQGTLFGTSAMGGAIRFITPQPSLNGTSGVAKADIGYTQNGSPSYEVGAAYGAPVIAGVAGFRVSAWYQANGGWIDREDPFTGEVLQKNANSSENYVVRPAFTWVPMDNLSITAAAFLQGRHDGSPDSYWTDDLPNTEGGKEVWGGIKQPLTDNLHLSSLSVKYNFPAMTFESDTSYLDRHLTSINDFTHLVEYSFGGTPFIPGLDSFVSYEHDLSSIHAWQQEFRLTSQDPSSRVSWVAGTFYRRAVENLIQLIPPDLSPVTEAVYGKTSEQEFGVPDVTYQGQVLNTYTNEQNVDLSESVFGDITVNITSQLKADAGVRFEHSAVYDQSQSTGGVYYGSNLISQTLLDESQHPITPRFSLTYQYTDTDMVYASAAKGYRAGGGNSAAAVDNPGCDTSAKAVGYNSVPAGFQSDSLWSYEVGAKDQLFDRRLSLESSVYLIHWNDIQAGVGLPSCGSYFYTNQGNAISKGFDLQLAALVTNNLKFGARVGYTNEYYPSSYTTPAYDGTPGQLQHVSGDKVANVVPWTVAANANYSMDISPLWADTRGYFRIDYRWADKTTPGVGNPNDAGYDPNVTPYPDPAYSILNLRVGVTHSGWDLSAYVNNLTHANPLLGYYHDVLGEPLYYAAAIRPLTAGLTGWYRF